MPRSLAVALVVAVLAGCSHVEQAIEDAIEDAIDERIAAGELLTEDQAAEQATFAVEEATDQLRAEWEDELVPLREEVESLRAWREELCSAIESAYLEAEVFSAVEAALEDLRRACP